MLARITESNAPSSNGGREPYWCQGESNPVPRRERERSRQISSRRRDSGLPISRFVLLQPIAYEAHVSRILLIEDDAELGTQISAQLRGAGYEVVWWRRGRALTADDASAVQLVLLDLMLPGAHGMDVLKALRDGCAEVPVIVLSARNQTQDKVRTLRLGADDYLTKPFWPEELLERVRARLRRPTFERTGPIVLGPLRLDVSARELSRDGEPIAMTRPSSTC
jgi:CheY-like chemotaxis protein